MTLNHFLIDKQKVLYKFLKEIVVIFVTFTFYSQKTEEFNLPKNVREIPDSSQHKPQAVLWGVQKCTLSIQT